MKLSDIFVLFALIALIAIVEGQFAAAARGLYQPILLSVGTVFTAMNSISKEDYSGWTAKWVDKFITKSTTSDSEHEGPGDEIQPGDDNDLDTIKDFKNEKKPYKNKIDSTVLTEELGSHGE